MAGVIGAASDFYRLRLVRVDEGGEPDLEWRDDILYRHADAQVPEGLVRFTVQAVSLDDAETAWAIGAFADSGEAHAFLAAAEEHLAALTKSGFDVRYGIPAA